MSTKAEFAEPRKSCNAPKSGGAAPMAPLSPTSSMTTDGECAPWSGGVRNSRVAAVAAAASAGADADAAARDRCCCPSRRTAIHVSKNGSRMVEICVRESTASGATWWRGCSWPGDLFLAAGFASGGDMSLLMRGRRRLVLGVAVAVAAAVSAASAAAVVVVVLTFSMESAVCRCREGFPRRQHVQRWSCGDR